MHMNSKLQNDAAALSICCARLLGDVCVEHIAWA